MGDNSDDPKKHRPSGILRLDINKPRRSSGGSVEFRHQPELLGEISPSSPLTPQLSVTWAFLQDNNNENDNNGNIHDHDNDDDDVNDAGNGATNNNKNIRQQENSDDQSQMSSLLKSPSSGGGINSPYKKLPHLNEKRGVKLKDELTFQKRDRGKESPIYMEPASPLEVPEVDSEDEDYSISVSAIMQRRASTRGNRKRSYRSPRRTSSPMGHAMGFGGTGPDRRRSSVYTTSSGETAISFEDGTNQDSTQEQIFENIRLHKEVLQSVKLQAWSMRRKLRLVRQAKAYVARHEGALQERFAMSRSTRDLWARFKLVLAAKWQHCRRELANISTVLIPWESRIKEIESHFGSVVASYFTFLRWLFWVNIVIAVVLTVFVVVPEVVATDLVGVQDDRKQMLPEEKATAAKLITIWDFEGFLKYSPLFYGYYSDISGALWGYKLPLAYFLTGLVVYIYSFVATLRKMAENSRMSKLSSKDDECIFSWKLFTGWDFMIGHAETAHNRVASVVLSFKEALLEEAEKRKDKRNWKVIGLRIIVNLLVIGLLCISAYAVVLVVNRSTDSEANDSWWRRNEITVVMSLISFFFPMIFEGLGFMESYHPRQQLRLQLARIMLLNLLNLYSLIFALFDKITDMNSELSDIKKNICSGTDATMTTLMTSTTMAINGSDFNHILDNLKWNPSPTVTIENSDLFGSAATLMSNLLLDTTMKSTDFSGFETTTNDIETVTSCYEIEVNCSKFSIINTTLMTSLLLFNVTTSTVLPELFSKFMVTTSDYNVTTPTNLTEDNFLNAIDYFIAGSGYELNETSASNTTMNFTMPDDFYSFVDGNMTKRKFHKKRQINIDDENYDYTEEEIGVENEEEIKDNSMNVFDLISHYLANLTDYVAGTTETTNENDGDDIMTRENVTEIIEMTLSTFWENVTTEFPDLTTAPTSDNITEMVTTIIEELTTQMMMTMPPTRMENDNDKCYETICDNVTDVTEIDRTDSNFPDIVTELGIIETTTTRSTPHLSSAIDVTATITTKATTTTDELASLFVPTNETITELTIPPLINSTTGDSTTISYEQQLLACNDIQVLRKRANNIDLDTKIKLRRLCWETMFGQELVKLTVMDLLITIISTLLLDFFRALFVRFMNKCWCWDLEKRYPKYGDFKIAENILHLVNNQGMVWMGMFFSPGLAILNLAKLVVILYLRSWAVLTCNVPHEVVFRASRSNNFYLALLLTMLFLCVLPVAFAIVWLEPSWHCGPFSNCERIYFIFTESLREALPKPLHKPMEYIASPSTVIPLLLLLILIIYYLISYTGALREANQDLRNQLRRERTEERRKMLKMAESKSAIEAESNVVNTISARWKRVLSSPLTPTGAAPVENDESKIQAKKELLQRIMKKALRKGSATSDDDSTPAPALANDDETDTEQHDSLPHDHDGYRNVEERDNRVNKKKRVTSKISAERKREILPEILKKLREAAKKQKDEDAEIEKNNEENQSGKRDVTNSHPKRRFKIEKVADSVDLHKAKIRNEQNVKQDDNDEDDKERVVMERRKSLLKKQHKANDAVEDASAGKNKTDQYDVVNEKNSRNGKKAGVQIEPQVFKFDEETIKRDKKQRKGKQNRSDNEESDEEERPKILPHKTRKHIDPQDRDTLSMKSRSDSYSSNGTTSVVTCREMINAQPEMTHYDKVKPRESPPEYAVAVKTKFKKSRTPSPDYKAIEEKSKNIAGTSKEKVAVEPTTPTSPITPSLFKDPMKGGIKKLNSFMALVREAVQAKKIDQDPPKLPESESEPISLERSLKSDIEVETHGSLKRKEKSKDNRRNSKSTTTSSASAYGRPDRPTKRQDSMASIWSDNIPVITISKTESDECILEDKEEEKMKKRKKMPQDEERHDFIDDTSDDKEDNGDREPKKHQE